MSRAFDKKYSAASSTSGSHRLQSILLHRAAVVVNGQNIHQGTKIITGKRQSNSTNRLPMRHDQPSPVNRDSFKMTQYYQDGTFDTARNKSTYTVA